jgi:adenylosuccinate lyase
VDAHLIDSTIFGHLWSSAASVELFGERSRLARWLHVIAALARAQAATAIIPTAAAAAISQLRVDDLDISRIAAGTRATSHSTLGLIHELQRALPESARQHVYYGVTVQDITDTSLTLELMSIADVILGDLWAIEGVLMDLAESHRATPMCGRTHGQPGAPITFGYKVASWLDELGRHLGRLREARPRWAVAQLGGAVGTLGFFGDRALALRGAFAAELDLSEPSISWLTARDRLAEFANLMAMVTATLARIANEVYSLQRLEVGELLEASTAAVVGSITMPHKRNPESSEHVVTLAKLVRVQAGLLTETMVQEHERDGRGWKAEWVAFPELCHYATAATSLSRSLVSGIEVRSDAMLSNLRNAGATSSEQLLRHLSGQLGKHQAQEALQEAYRLARATGRPITDHLPSGVTIAETDLLDAPNVGAAAAMTDLVLADARRRRASDGLPQ